MSQRSPLLLAACLAGLVAPMAVSSNLLRNGSFEGSLLYWHNVDPERHWLVHGDAAVGEYCLRIEDGWVMSAPFVCENGRDFTVSFFVKGDSEGEVHVQLPPSAREVGQRADRLWTGAARRLARIDRRWRRVSFTSRADVPNTGFWPYPHYMVLIEGTVPLQVDGVTATIGGDGSESFAPRRPVEVLSDCGDLKGYKANGNLLERGATVRLVAHASNPGDEPRTVTLRWQLIDYEGSRPVGAPIDKLVTVPAGATISETVHTRLDRTGCVLARVTAMSDGKQLDRSDLPLTSLPYAMGPRKPDPRERFGGSFFGPHSASLGSRLGFAWSRWYPHTKWHDHQPDGPDSWRWFDDELDVLEKLGISAHLVLYGWPEWIMHRDHPLPKDMRWPADDPRWNNLTIETAWDRYMRGVAEHYKGRNVVYEIENEPRFDGWEGHEDQYARFTIRSARVIKQVNPLARVMVNNVYAIPGGLNRRLLERGGAAYIDIISWHDYHEGWLADAAAMQRMRGAVDALGGEHVEIWFNEGWAFTNTAVDEPNACTHLTSAQSTNAMVCSVAELTAAGQDKTILFHTGYEEHGMSFWDYCGPGTMLWDWYGYPLPLVAAWNTLVHHIGLSRRVGVVRPEGATFCIFEDLRNGRGVMIAYADRESPADVTVGLPFSNMIGEDAMGNAAALNSETLTLAQNGRPVFLYDRKGTSGMELYRELEPLDRKYAGFVSGDGARFRLPPVWRGEADGSQQGNPARADGQPIWRLDQVWPPNPADPDNYRPLVWQDGWWRPVSDSFGDQPKAELKDRGIRMEFRAAHGQPAAARLCGLAFIAPRGGDYQIRGTAQMRLWDGDNPVRLALLHKTADTVAEVGSIPLIGGERVALEGFTAEVEAGDELVLLPRIEGRYTGGDVILRDVRVTLKAR